MPRLKIDFPENVLASFEIPVRISDINYGNHVGNDSFVAIIHEARMKWLSSYGFTELKIGDTGLIMSSLQLDFKSEVSYGETINVELAVADISQIRFELLYKLSTTRNSE